MLLCTSKVVDVTAQHARALDGLAKKYPSCCRQRFVIDTRILGKNGTGLFYVLG